MARAARANYESTSEEFDTRRLAMMIGGGLAVVLIIVFLGVKIFGSKSEAPRPVAAVTHAPEYPQEVTDLIAQTEEAFKTDDFKTARADVDELRQISPSHPRLGFFEGLLIARADDPKGGAANASASRGASRKNGKVIRSHDLLGSIFKGYHRIRCLLLQPPVDCGCVIARFTSDCAGDAG